MSANRQSPPETTSDPDPRRRQLEQWLADAAGISGTGEAVSSDASFRRYFRYRDGQRSVVAMDAPPDSEDCHPFVLVARRLAAAGVTVPAILAEDLQRGFLLLSDLGTETYLDRMNAPDCSAEEVNTLFVRAIDALVRFQKWAASEDLPPYDAALLRRELDLFPRWYLRQHCGIETTGDWGNLLERLFRRLIDQVSGQGLVFVHRDYMPRNLMVMPDDVGVLDFQDAVRGPISYDPVCLFKDAFVSWPESRVQAWLHDYWQQAGDAGLPVPPAFEAFLRDCDFMGVQRHLKVLGIFARICHRDGKPHYLEDAPRFLDYLRTVARRRPEITELGELLERLP